MPEPSLYSRPILFTEIEQFGGAERSALALCRWLAERGLEHHIVVYEDRCWLAASSASPLAVVQLKPGNGVRAKVAALRKYFAGRPANAPRALLSGYQPALHATLAGVRGFHTLMHDTPALFDDPFAAGAKHRLRRFVSDKIVGYGLRSGGETIVTSDFLRDDCRKTFGVTAEIARMGGLPGRSHGLRASNESKQFRMLSVCRLEPNKRLDWMLRALAKLEHEKMPALSTRMDWHFDVVGKGPELEKLRALAERLDVGDRVHFYGFVSDVRLDALYAEARLFVMPAVQGYGIPAIEAIERGIPVLLHRDSGVSDILRDTAWATVFEGGEENTAAALAKSMESVLSGKHFSAPLPELPTEDAWAERVARLCGWVPEGVA